MTERDEWTHLDELLTDYGNAAYTDGNNNADDSSERFTKSEAALRAAYDALRARAEAAEGELRMVDTALGNVVAFDECHTRYDKIVLAMRTAREGHEAKADRDRLAAQIAKKSCGSCDGSGQQYSMMAGEITGTWRCPECAQHICGGEARPWPIDKCGLCGDGPVKGAP